MIRFQQATSLVLGWKETKKKETKEEKEEEEKETEEEAVSYTHLDVYKRQVLPAQISATFYCVRSLTS